MVPVPLAQPPPQVFDVAHCATGLECCGHGLRISRDRARVVREVCREILRDRDIEHDRRDIMTLVLRLRRDTSQFPAVRT